ncbi:MAG: glycosyltransferase family 2 protein [Anaerolineales bacterium]|jgi:undecaprenyl-phosphate 4-deoxy-4-formamido-L-arabinose transferase
MNCSVVIPVYQSQATLPELVERLEKVLSGLSENHEVILVNDDSSDQSWDIITALAKQYPCVRGVDLMRNYGQHNSSLCGVRLACYEVIITMDDDLQHLPEEIHILLEKLGEGYDVVYGIPKRLPHSWWRNLGSVLSKLMVASAIGIKTIRDVSSFRAFRTDLRQAFDGYNNPDVMLDVLLSWGTTHFAAVPVDEQPRSVGKSNYTIGRLLRMWLLYLTNFSTKPLRFSNIIGFFFTLIGFIGFIYVITIYFIEGSVPGFPFLASAIMIFSGVQLFALGIIGEYLARVFERTAGRRPYTIARTTSEASSKQP